MATINDFKAVLAGGGARANQFQVTMPFPGFAAAGGETRVMSFLCQATNLPGMTLGEVAVPFRGRQLYIAGDRTFDTWTITVINDTDFAIRRTMEEWAQLVAQYQDGSGATDPSSYMGSAIVRQLGRKKSNIGDGAANSKDAGLEPIAVYRFADIYPTNISAIDLSYDTTDTIEEFTVEFTVNYWYPENKSGPAGASA